MRFAREACGGILCTVGWCGVWGCDGDWGVGAGGCGGGFGVVGGECVGCLGGVCAGCGGADIASGGRSETPRRQIRGTL